MRRTAAAITDSSQLTRSSHEPDNRNGVEFCVALNDRPEYYGRWLDAPCTTKFHLICETNSKDVADDVNEVSNEQFDAVRQNDVDSGGNGGTTALLTLLVVTLSLFVASLLIVVYTQRRRLLTVLRENRFVTRYRGGHTWTRTGGTSMSSGR